MSRGGGCRFSRWNTRPAGRKCASCYKAVSRQRPRGPFKDGWQAAIMRRGRRGYLGSFYREYEALVAFNRAAGLEWTGMTRKRVIVDCYTDEPAGLGVPPFLGVWPRYVAGGYRDEPTYLTIDDVRLAAWQGPVKAKTIDPASGKTRIDLLNHTRCRAAVREILEEAEQLVVVAGVQTPGKYLSGLPGTPGEIVRLLDRYECRRILTGPVVSGGSQMRGGAAAERVEEKDFDEQRETSFDDYAELQSAAVKGAGIIKQIPQGRIVEIETGRGCSREPGCSFCTEPLKHRLQWRRPEDIIEEVRTFVGLGVEAFRLGKQSCIFSYQKGDVGQLERLLAGLAQLRPEVLHIDNANPTMVTEARTRLFVRYLTPGSTAALGVESFDPEVGRLNNLNSSKEAAFEAIRTINRYGAERGKNGCPRLLPGINILLGLEGETTETLERNLEVLKELLDEGLLVRRINVRQVVAFAGTRLAKRVGSGIRRKNHRYYARWMERVREEIDRPMLERLFPAGTILRRMESAVHEGNVTFMRQVGSYPIIVGVRRRLPLGEFFDVCVTGHMRRSLTGQVL